MDANKLGAVRQLQQSFPALTVSEARQLLQECNWNVRSALSAAEAREQQHAAQERGGAANFFVGGSGRGGSAQQVEAPPSADFRAMAASLLAQMNVRGGPHRDNPHTDDIGEGKHKEGKTAADARSIIEQLFAQAGSRDDVEERASLGGSEAQAFYGRGQRLGYTELPSPYIAPTLRQNRDVTIAVYRNGFYVEEENLFIALESPDGAEFASSLQHEHVPALLARRYPNTDITASVRDVQTRDYVAGEVRAGRDSSSGGGGGAGRGGVTATSFFQGTGRRLTGDRAQDQSAHVSTAADRTGGEAHGSSDDSKDKPASGNRADNDSREFHLDEGETCVSLILVTTAGKKEEVRVNPTRHTVEDLYTLAHRLQPELADFDLVVRDMPPRRLDGAAVRAQTIDEAKLKRAVVTIRAR